MKLSGGNVVASFTDLTNAEREISNLKLLFRGDQFIELTQSIGTGLRVKPLHPKRVSLKDSPLVKMVKGSTTVTDTSGLGLASIDHRSLRSLSLDQKLSFSALQRGIISDSLTYG